MVKIVAFSGSGRRDSVNKKVVAVAAKGAEEEGAQVTIVNLEDFNLPFFTEDLEAERGMDPNAQKFKALLINSDGFLISSPEYNSSYSALFKNAIDWASRKIEGETPLQAYRGKVAGIMAASPGGLGGMRVLVTLRMLMENLGTMVLPGQIAISDAFSKFDDNGNITDEATEKALKNIGKTLVETCRKLNH
ncbi:NAD(P)H-dependent oxidoreductase [Aliiglaciecola sp. 3_MG-2023]|uniref:NADPH-dependent FMN reductase n=1 Tax=Aliiglaciecola sp. 3_MG-2023 TaxID=3062644 RepID=UPI0026E1E718|nr:NAD(P)H-dependent oxidoreductase [Aliiglaciecola sp. 3_MG-2023]MDO6695353.1 NAD(P)H-dependent oxidoreductase [Aliiglaciecola sp. 3_MG-2023]